MDPNGGCFSAWTAYNYIVCTLLCVTGFAYVCLGAFLTGVKSAEAFGLSNVVILGLTIICLGVILYALAIYGCVTTRRENFYWLLAYSIALCCVLVIEGVIAYFSLAFRQDHIDESRQYFERLIRDYHEPKGKEGRNTMDYIQQKHSCCGVYKPSDWIDHLPLPQSCCPNDYLFKCTLNSTRLYRNGCLKPMTDVYVRCLTLVASLSIIGGILQAPIAILATQLALAIRAKASRQVPSEDQGTTSLFENS